MNAQPLICAFEPSAAGRLGARVAAWLAEALGAPLQLIHVFDPGGQPALPREGVLIDPVLLQEVAIRRDERARARARSSLEALVRELPRIDASCQVLEGRVVPTLLATAAARRAALLVSGTAARAGLEHVLKGSVSGSLAAEASCPVVIVPPAAAIAPRGPVLVGDDGSEHARRAVRHAARFAHRLGRELVRLEIADGDPAEGLAEAGREHAACLIVTGTRGRGSIRAELFGSVSSRLVQTAGRPVMLVPAGAMEPA